jgi:hypothetical protein
MYHQPHNIVTELARVAHLGELMQTKHKVVMRERCITGLERNISIVIMKREWKSTGSPLSVSCRTASGGLGLRALLAEGRPCFLGRDGYALLDARKAVERRADVERENRRTVRLGRRRVVVNHVAHLLARVRPLDDPVVPVERRLRAGRDD